jgi:hypothetical protein
MRAWMTSLALAATLALSLGVLVKGADGYVISGRAWPGGVVRYYNAATDQRWAVQQAVNAWNSSGARVRFVAVPAAQAQLRIEHFRKATCTINAGATVGYTLSGRVWVFRRDEASPYCNSYVAVQAITHELGHVLGLGHETRGCSLMNPSGSLRGPSLCPKAEPWQWRCQLLTADDVAGAVALYGGKPRRQEGSQDCDLYAGIRSPAGLGVAWTSAPQQVRVTFRRPPSIAIPTLLSAREVSPESFVTVATRDRCETDARAHPRYAWSARPGAMQSKLITLAAGTYCVAVWAVDSFGRPSDRPAALWVRI